MLIIASRIPRAPIQKTLSYPWRKLPMLLLLSALVTITGVAAGNDDDTAHRKLLSASGGLRNISTNGFVDDNGLVAGFIVEGRGTRRFAITGEDQDGNLDAALILTSLDGSVEYGRNERWQDHPTATELLGQLRPLGRSSDAGFTVSLAPGAYVARLYAQDGCQARGLVSVTELSTGSGGGLRNISTNGLVDGTGMLAGFIIEGGTRRLAVTGEDQDGNLDAALTLSSLDGRTEYGANDDWQSHPSAGELQSSLRPLGRWRDAGFVVDLPPGSYVARLHGQGCCPARGLASVTDLGHSGGTAPGGNRPPVAESMSLVTDPGVLYVEQQLFGSDPDGDAILYMLRSPGTGAGYEYAYLDQESGRLYVTLTGTRNHVVLDYQVTDGQLSSPTARISISIQGNYHIGNRPPVAESVSLVTDPGVLYVDQQLFGSDPDGDAILYMLLSPESGAGYEYAYLDQESGRLYVNLTGTRNHVVLDYQVTDGQLFSPTARVSISIQEDHQIWHQGMLEVDP